MKTIKVGSLFDGSGAAPFAAQICGAEPVWASEIEPFPILVTRKRFPDMKHLGDIVKIDGSKIEPVDAIVFGSPCVDLSIAGNRKGLSGERSGLFTEAIRIIKEMRVATNGRYGNIAVWENVPGAFSSNSGEDFRVVLEEFCKIKDGNAVIPRPPRGKWSDAGEIVGDGYSVAWRVLDASGWGVPQRRRRIFLVADFRSECAAGEILFERGGLSRNFSESRESWQGITRSLAFGSGHQDGDGLSRECGITACSSNSTRSANSDSRICEAETARTLDLNGGNPACNQGGACLVQVHDARGNGDGDIAPTITGDHNGHASDYTAVVCGMNWDGGQVAPTSTKNNAGGNQRMPDKDHFNAVICVGANGDKAIPLDASYYKGQGEREGKERDFVCYAVENHPGDSRIKIDERGICQTLRSRMGTGGGNEPCVLIVCGVDGYNVAEACNDDQYGYRESQIAENLTAGVAENVAPTTTCIHGGEPVTTCLIPCEIILRRLTPTECARLQGMPDWWTEDIDIKDPSEEDVAFWREVFETHRQVTAPNKRPKTDNQIRKFLKQPYSDSAQYKMWGNGMALPNILYVMEGVVESLKGEQ